MNTKGSTQEHTRLCHAVRGYLIQIRAYECKNLGGVGQRAGRPDFDCCIKGRFVGIEVKTGGGELSKDQKREQRRILDAGGLFLEIHDLDELEHMLVAAGLTTKRLVLEYDFGVADES